MNIEKLIPTLPVPDRISGEKWYDRTFWYGPNSVRINYKQWVFGLSCDFKGFSIHIGPIKITKSNLC